MQPLEDAIIKSFLPRLTGQNTFNCQLRDLLALPARLGGLSIIKLVPRSQLIFDNSTRLTRPLVDLILQQSTSLPFEVIEAQSTARREIRHEVNSRSLSFVTSCSLNYQLLFNDQWKLPAKLAWCLHMAFYVTYCLFAPMCTGVHTVSTVCTGVHTLIHLHIFNSCWIPVANFTSF